MPERKSLRETAATYQRLRESGIVDAALLSAGKALHLANQFEANCIYILRVDNLIDLLKVDPVLKLEEVAAKIPKDKMLGGTIKELSKSQHGTREDQTIALEKARIARNYIAHEGARVGYVNLPDEERIRTHLAALRAAVIDLLAGDYIVTRWVYELEEKEPWTSWNLNSYIDHFEQWVFSHLDSSWWQTK